MITLRSGPVRRKSRRSASWPAGTPVPPPYDQAV